MSGKDLRSIGERKAIEMVSRILSKGTVPVGIGDDCAALEIGDDYLLITTDMMTQRTHASRASAKQMGWYLVAVNLSDIGAKGGQPLGLVTALGLPKGTHVSFLQELSRGMNACAKEFGTTIIGGDTKESKEVSLAATAFGTVPKENFMPRSGAKVGDVVAVTGTLGLAAAGMEALRLKLRRPKALKALLEPWPRVREGISLGETQAVSSSIDISDGLSTSLHHLAKASRVGFKVDFDNLPITDEVQKFGLDENDAGLHFGGDYELLITFQHKNLDLVVKAVGSHGTELTVIGEVTRKGISIKKDGKVSRLGNHGWEHFKPPKKVKRKKVRKRKRSPSRSSR